MDAPDAPRGHVGGEDGGALVVSQVALALVLFSLVGSGLMIRSFQALGDVQPGFVEPDDVLSFKISIPETEIADLEQTSEDAGADSAASRTASGRHVRRDVDVHYDGRMG